MGQLALLWKARGIDIGAQGGPPRFLLVLKIIATYIQHSSKKNREVFGTKILTKAAKEAGPAKVAIYKAKL